MKSFFTFMKRSLMNSETKFSELEPGGLVCVDWSTPNKIVNEFYMILGSEMRECADTDGIIIECCVFILTDEEKIQTFIGLPDETFLSENEKWV